MNWAGVNMFRVGLIGLVMALLSGPAVAEKAPILLKPNSPWNLHYDENSCKLLRSFGDKAQPTVMVLERMSLKSNLSLLVFGAGLTSRMGDPSPKAAFLPFRSNSFDEGLASETSDKKAPAIYWTSVGFRSEGYGEEELRAFRDREVRDLARDAAEALREEEDSKAITGLEITERRGQKIVLVTGPISRANAMMRDCAKRQLLTWGVNPEVEEKIVRPAKPLKPLNRLFSSNNYPGEALRRGDQSVISARFLIDSKGNVTGCTSLSVYKAPGFAETVCERFKQAKFRPAELADGTKVPTYDTATIKFLMP